MCLTNLSINSRKISAFKLLHIYRDGSAILFVFIQNSEPKRRKKMTQNYTEDTKNTQNISQTKINNHKHLK